MLRELRDWAHLPGTALQLISEKLKFVTDYVRFRAVCSPWRSASIPKPQHLPPQLPWLLIPWDSRDIEDDGTRLFYDLWESKMRKIHLPETRGMVCWSSDHGWLLLSDKEGKEIFLLNPLTRARIHLPPFADDGIRFGHGFGDFGVRKVTFSADPTNPDCLISILPWGCGQLFSCRVRDLSWNMVECKRSMDATYYNGQFYLLYMNAILVVDLDNPEERIVHFFEPNLIGFSKFLIEGKSVVYTVSDSEEEPAADDIEEITDSEYVRRKTELYKLQVQPLKLEKVTDAGSPIIFCDRNNWPYLAVYSDDWEFLDGGSVYTVVTVLSLKDGVEGGSHYNICMAKQGDFELKSEMSNIGKGPQNSSSARPMWFQPSPF